MQRLRMVLVSNSARGGSSGNALNGSAGRQTGERLEDFLLTDAMPGDYVESFDTST
jgi:hypothetical protein